MKPGRPTRSQDKTLNINDLRGGATGAERREEERLHCQRKITILPCTSNAKWDFKDVQLFDCSPHGLAIISVEPMKRGDEFLARMKVKRMTMVIYRVGHCATLPDGTYKIGARLVEMVGSPDEILQALLDSDDSASN